MLQLLLILLCAKSGVDVFSHLMDQHAQIQIVGVETYAAEDHLRLRLR
jgi:hypothetical protein